MFFIVFQSIPNRIKPGPQTIIHNLFSGQKANAVIDFQIVYITMTSNELAQSHCLL